jgi:hypothetical protein
VGDAAHRDRDLFVSALRDAVSGDRRFGELLARYRTSLRTDSEHEAPFVEEELRRAGLSGSPKVQSGPGR